VRALRGRQVGRGALLRLNGHLNPAWTAGFSGLSSMC
jgi:hypothetical protein